MWKFVHNKKGLIMIKKIFLLSLILFSSSICYSMQKMNDNQLEQISAGDAVGILADHLYIYSAFNKISFFDKDGLSGSDGASLALNNLEFDVVRFEALARDGTIIYDPDEQHLQGDARFDTSQSNYITDFQPSILTINVIDELPVMSAMSNFKLYDNQNKDDANYSGLYIGLPTIETYIDETNLGSITISSLYSSIANSDKSFAHIYTQSMQLDILGGKLEIAPHPGYGISMALDDVVIFTKIPKIIIYDEEGIQNTDYQFRLKNIDSDVLRINSISHVDIDGIIHSIGQYDLYVTNGNSIDEFNTKQIDYYNFTQKRSFNPITLDLSNNLPSLSSQKGLPIAGILVGLPSLEFYLNDLRFDFTVGEEDDEWLGKILIKGLDLCILEGNIEIAPHYEYGVDIIPDDIVVYLSSDQIGYMDIDDNSYLWINNYEFDTMYINALYKDSNGNLLSPGKYPSYITQDNNHLSNSAVQSNFSPSALTIDITSNLPKMSLHYGDNRGGIYLNLPSLEIFTKKIGIGSITLERVDGAQNNNRPLFTNMAIKDAKTAILGGSLEIAPH